MARMIPPLYDRDLTSPGEAWVFETLCSDTVTSDWVVLHSLSLARHVERLEGEIDFVVIIPGSGIICLEVKGVRTIRRREDGVWEIGAQPLIDPRGPFKQASEGMHSLRNYVLKRQPPLAGIPFMSAVVFPYLTFSEESVEWRAGQVIDHQRIRGLSLGSAVLASVKSELAHFRESSSSMWLADNDGYPTAVQVDLLVSVLRPRFEKMESPRARRGRREKELLELTGEQYRALDQMQENRAVLFQGPAGTGKTYLAMEAARREAALDRSVLFLCFNKLLAVQLSSDLGVDVTPDKWIASLRGDRSERSVTIGTLHRLLVGLAGNPPTEAQARDSRYWSKDLPDAALETLLDGAPPADDFDVLIVDEAQDIVEPAYLDVLDLCLKGGLRDGRSLWFGDFEKQLIYAGSGGRYALDQRCAHLARCSLRTNCRNVPSIAKFAHLLGGLDPDYAKVLRPDPGGRPALSFYSTPPEQKVQLSGALQSLLGEDIKPSEIVLLSPSANSKAASSLSSGQTGLSPLNNPRGGTVRWGTVHSFKGLEAPAVILTDIESLDAERLQDLFYVGITRALDHLRIVAHTQVQRWIRQVLER